MKYIEENFNDAYVQDLSDDEIRQLTTFLKEQVSIESVECICLKPEYREIDRRYYDDSYCSVEIKIIVHKESSDLKWIERSICEARRCLPFISYIPTNEFKFVITDINSFNSDSIITKSWNERDLVSSYILFDRNGIFEKLQDELRENKESWAGLSKIVNIDKLNIEPSKKKVLSINN